ncbi:MAG: NMD3-related protein [Candidatus Lokiarchaeota archaeon]
MPNKFCMICGKALDKNAPNFSTCLECYIKENPLFELPESFNFKVCSDCFSYSKSNEWIRPENDDILDIIQSAVHTFLLEHFNNYEDIEFEFSFNKDNFGFTSKDLLDHLEVEIIGASLSDPRIVHKESMNINIHYDLCENCANIRGGMHYVSILQLRVKDESYFDNLKEIMDDIQVYMENLHQEDPKQYISKLVDQKNGLDLYLSTNQLLNYLISYLRSKYNFYMKRSKKLVGRDIQRGKNIYRLKSVLKFLPVDKGNIVVIGTERYVVDQILKNKVILKSESNQKITKRFQYFFGSQTNIILRNEE